jgi:hypothetical protein
LVVKALHPVLAALHTLSIFIVYDLSVADFADKRGPSEVHELVDF